MPCKALHLTSMQLALGRPSRSIASLLGRVSPNGRALRAYLSPPTFGVAGPDLTRLPLDRRPRRRAFRPLALASASHGRLDHHYWLTNQYGTALIGTGAEAPFSQLD